MASIKRLITNIANLKDAEKRPRLILLGGAITLGVILFTAIGLPLTSNSSFCGSICHTTAREYYSWKRSAHANISCVACHGNRGQIAFFYEKLIEGPKFAYAEITGNFERPINTNSHVGKEKIPRANCERCHDLKKRRVTPSLRFKSELVGTGEEKYHAKHLNKGIPCTLCHNRVAHKDVNKPEVLKLAKYSETSKEAKTQYVDGMNMVDGCFRCHSPFEKERDKALIKKYKAEKAPKECTNCHDKKILPVGHGKNWDTKHVKAAKKKGFDYCLKCHGKGKRFQSPDKKRSRCRDCHHRLLAKKTLVLDSCKRCHEEMALAKDKLVSTGVDAMRKENNKEKAQYYRRMVYHKVHFSKKYKCTKCHQDDLETTKKTTFELCKNEGCHPLGQEKPPSGTKLCKQCHFSPHSN